MMNVARLILIGTTKLGYTEQQIFAMTPRKFFLLYDEYLIVSGAKKSSNPKDEEDTYAIDEIMGVLRGF